MTRKLMRKIKFIDDMELIFEKIAFVDFLIVAASLDATPYWLIALAAIPGAICAVCAWLCESIKTEYEQQCEWRSTYRTVNAVPDSHKVA